MGSRWADDRDRGHPRTPGTASASRSTLVRPSGDHRRFRVVVLVQDELGTVAVGETEVEAKDQRDAVRVVKELGGVAAEANPLLLIGR